MAASVTVYLWILVPLTVFGALVISIVLAGRRFNSTVFRGQGPQWSNRQGLFVNVVDPALPVGRRQKSRTST
ncbi:hypothetical protein ABT299_42775 [Spirillospora sp. NPDC000708]|jgi:hypothetical protein|uniref:hypothetical protein n=1 Tax=Actinomadura TaxID=1988 RepID=UPI001685A61D|nr:hypothetical protein [Actinomadura sp. RB99]MBD2898349.1 hypothetical protein [Actinomadura sp. RB99]